MVAGTASITACASGCVNGTTASTITVTAVDQFSNPINGASVNPIATTGLGNTFTPSFGSTNASGVLTSLFNSTQATTKPITATVNGVLITQSPTVTVTPDAVSLTTSTLSVSSASMTACSTGCVVGSTAVTVTEVVRDQFSNVRPGSAAGLSATGTVNTFTPASGVTDGTGTFQSTFNATLIGLHTISATANFATITQTQGVTVNAAAAATIAVNGTTTNRTARITAGVATPVGDREGCLRQREVRSQCRLRYGHGRRRHRGNAQTTNASGIATLPSWTMGSSGAITKGAHLNTLTVASTAGVASLTFADSGVYFLSLDVQPIWTANCISCHGGGVAPILTTGNSRAATVGITSTCASASLGSSQGAQHERPLSADVRHGDLLRARCRQAAIFQPLPRTLSETGSTTEH